MIWDIPLLIIGIAALGFGARWLVSGSAQIAVAFGVSPFVVGLTVVGFGTSSPELTLALFSGSSGHNTLVLANVIGANIAICTYIPGISALIMPLVTKFDVVRREAWATVIALSALILLSADGELTQVDGIILLAVFIIYTMILLRTTLRSVPGTAVTYEYQEATAITRSPLRNIAFIIIGLLALIIGVQAITSSATSLAMEAGISEYFIGLTVISIGTTLPELITSILAARKGETDIVEQRLETIQTETPGMNTIYEIEEGEDTEWGRITISQEDGEPLAFEFIESIESLMRPSALDQYNEAAEVGRVIIIVPDSAYEAAAEMLSKACNPSIELIGYGVIGLTLMA